MAGENGCQEKHTDLETVLQTAQEFSGRVAETELDLKSQVQDLNTQISTLQTINSGLKSTIDGLQRQLSKAKKDCYDPDSPEAMAGDVRRPSINDATVAPTNNEGTVSGDGSF